MLASGGGGGDSMRRCSSKVAPHTYSATHFRVLEWSCPALVAPLALKLGRHRPTGCGLRGSAAQEGASSLSLGIRVNIRVMSTELSSPLSGFPRQTWSILRLSRTLNQLKVYGEMIVGVVTLPRYSNTTAMSSFIYDMTRNQTPKTRIIKILVLLFYCFKFSMMSPDLVSDGSFQGIISRTRQSVPELYTHVNLIIS